MQDPSSHAAPGGGRAARFVDWTLRHGRLLWIIAIVLAVPATLRTGWLYAHLQSDLEELLPRKSPSVIAIDEFRARVGGRQYMGVVVDAARAENVPAAERFVDDLKARLLTYPKDVVAAVRTGNDEERAFLEKNGSLYMDVEDLEVIRARIAARRDYEVSRQTGALLDDDAAPPPVEFKEIEAKYQARAGIGKGGPSATSRYTSVDKHLTVLLIELGGFSSGSGSAGALHQRVTADIASLGFPDRYAPGMKLGFAGDATIQTEELSALVADLSLSSVVVVFAVIAAIVIYFRWWRSIFIVFPPLLLATVYSFGLASVPPFGVTAVNSNTAFLGSIIVGNGINFALILLSRYVEERRAGLDVRAALVESVARARGGTLAAAAAAGVSYASLALTQFRGFRQFGFIGGLGMLFAWGAAFVLMPSLIARLDHGETTRPRKRPEGSRFSVWVARAVSKAPTLITLVTVVLTVVAVAEVSRFRSTDLETDFSRLRRRDTWTEGEGYWGRKMNEVLGEYLTPLVFLADRPEDAQKLAAQLRRDIDKPPFTDRIERIRTIEDVVPTRQGEKLEVLDRIREDLTPNVRSALAPSQRAYVDRLLGTDDTLRLAPIALRDLPRTFTLGLEEKDGSVGKIVLVSPNVHASWWDGNMMSDFVGALRREANEAVAGAEPPRASPRLAGSIPLSTDIVEAIGHDGPLASILAFVGVVAVVFLLIRRRGPAVHVVVALLVGVLWLAGLSRLLHVHINFANFIAFPITFGIGVDYAVNVVSRHEQDGGTDILAAVKSTGAAVALCSLTTIIGYSSLLMAENQALFLFGLLAVMGEVACLGVALVSLPAFILMMHRRALAAETGTGASPKTEEHRVSAPSQPPQ
jgi:predicted RND superfamily exporter protein